MDQNKLPLIEIITNFLYKIKRLVVVLVLLAAKGFAATETANEPPSAVSPPPKTEPKINLQMAIFLGCLVTFFLLICFFFFYFRGYADRQLALAAATGHGGNQVAAMKLVAARGLDPTIVAAFKSFTYSTVKDIKIGQHALECAVCLNEFHDHEALRLLPKCSHVFHRDCIDEWLASHVTCPVCRASLVPRPSQLGHTTELTGGLDKHTKDHVSVEVVSLKHDLPPSRKLFRSFSMGHMIVHQKMESVDRYTLRLPDEVQNVLKNTRIGTDVSLLRESSLKTSLESASANFVRGSNSFDHERFGHERRGGRSFGITGSFISRCGSGSGFGSDIEDTATISERFFTSVKSPLNRLLQVSNKDHDKIKR